MSDVELAFWWLTIPVTLLSVLILCAFIVEAPPRWLKRMRQIQAGREAQRQAWQDTQDAERRKAAEWIAKNCFWRQT